MSAVSTCIENGLGLLETCWCSLTVTGGFWMKLRLGLMRRLAMAVALVGVAAVGVGQEAKTMLVVPPGPLLPQEFGAWKQTPDSATDANNVGPDATAVKECGVKRSTQALYTSGGRKITVSAMEFGDATGAYSAFTLWLRPGMKIGKDLGVHSASGIGEVLFEEGVTTVIAQGASAGDVPALRLLAARLPKVGGTKGLAPLLPKYLPVKGLQADTVRYALGPAGYNAMGGVLPGEILGFDKAGEAVMAKYAGKGTLTLFLYPTPQIAGDHGRQIEAVLNKPGVTGPSGAGTVKLRREGPLVLLTTGAWTAADAQAMVEGIHLRQDVTFDKKMPLEFHAEVQKTYSLLTSIAVLSGVLMTAAVILGLFLGGARAGIRMLQGKPAASEPEFLRIDLSGRSAKLHIEPGTRDGNAQA